MGRICQICYKGALVGNNVSHANNRTKRLFRPNLRLAVLTTGAREKRIKVCMSCYRKLREKSRLAELERKTTRIIEKSKEAQAHFSII